VAAARCDINNSRLAIVDFGSRMAIDMSPLVVFMTVVYPALENNYKTNLERRKKVQQQNKLIKCRSANITAIVDDNN